MNKKELFECLSGLSQTNNSRDGIDIRKEEANIIVNEIKRLNNIINELEKHFEFLKMNSTGGNKEFMEDILDYIKALRELKGSDKD